MTPVSMMTFSIPALAALSRSTSASSNRFVADAIAALEKVSPTACFTPSLWNDSNASMLVSGVMEFSITLSRNPPSRAAWTPARFTSSEPDPSTSRGISVTSTRCRRYFVIALGDSATTSSMLGSPVVLDTSTNAFSSASALSTSIVPSFAFLTSLSPE